MYTGDDVSRMQVRLVAETIPTRRETESEFQWLLLLRDLNSTPSGTTWRQPFNHQEKQVKFNQDLARGYVTGCECCEFMNAHCSGHTHTQRSLFWWL